MRAALRGGAQSVRQRDRQATASTVTADRDVFGRDTLGAQKAPRRQSVIKSRWKRMLRRQSVFDGKRARRRGSSCLGDEAAVADNRPGAIAAAVEIYQHSRGIASGRNRPFPRDTGEVHCGELHVGGGGPDSANLFDALSPRGPTDGPRLGGQQGSNRVDLALGHRFYLRAMSRASLLVVRR